jgi:hypothetical protein
MVRATPEQLLPVAEKMSTVHPEVLILWIGYGSDRMSLSEMTL